ncbi:MAG: methyltransferase domain-containing protein [Anaerolineaceae bacterium]
MPEPAGKALYDRIGVGYQSVRRPDSRIGSQIRAAIGDARSVVNVGAGAGSYEPDDVPTIAVEPSTVMISQRPAGAAPVILGVAERLPFRSNSFEVAMASFTVHHWRDPVVGLSEIQRVSRRQVVLTWDPVYFAEHFWFVRDYLAEDHQAAGSGTVGPIAESLGPSVSIEPVLVPADCTDGFYASYWARPEAFLDPAVRAGISAFALKDQDAVAGAIDRLSHDLNSGVWDRQYGLLRSAASMDIGYRLVLAGSPSGSREPTV